MLLGMKGSMNQENDGTSPLDYMAGMLTMMPNTSSRGGRLQRKNLYDGKTEPTGYLRRMKDANSGEVGDVVGLNDDGTYNVSYSNGIQPMALQAPELTVLGNYNPRRMSPEEKEALMRVQRGLDERPIGGELKNNQYRTMPTNSEANTFANAWASQTAPTVGHLIAAGLKPLDLVTPSRYVGLLDSDNKNGFLHLFDDDNRGLFINDNPNGMFSKRYAEEHPYWAMAGNMAFDIPASVAAGWAIGKGYNAASNAYNALADNGNLYIAGNTGVARVNIEETIEDITNIKIAVPFIDIDGERVYSDGDSGFHIPSTVKRLTIYSYVYNYSLIDPEVAYYLEGFDRDKKIVNRSELLPETYTNLAGGNYRFVIQLMDSHGNVGRTLSVPIVKDKALYEHVWFYALLAMGIVLLVVGAVHAILSQKTAALEKKNQEALKEQRLMTELHMANRIQGSILPHDFPPFPDRTEFEIYAVMDPAREVGGDFYDFFMIDNDHMGIVIADVSGKGIPAALFMMISKVIVQSCAMLGKSAGEILTKTNEALCSSNKVDMFVTVWIGILEISTGKISAANAGHEYPAIRKGDTFTLLKDKHGFVIGGMEDTVYTEYEIDLKPGDKLFVYTDGVPEATDIHNNMYGTERMLDALNNIGNAGPEQILDYIHESVNEFVGDAEQFDDLTMLCLEYKGI